MWDLKGLHLQGESIQFPHGDNFEAVDFSYSRFWHSRFEGAVFSCRFSFARIYNCEFVNCVFVFNGFYGSTFEKCKFTHCDFFESNSLTNCDLREVEFNGCFIPENIFFDCRFDENTEIRDLATVPARMKNSEVRLENDRRAGISRGIKDGFTAGGVVTKARAYYFSEMQCLTRFNSRGIADKISGYVLEYLSGYGMKPIRVLLAMLLIFGLSLLWFLPKVGFSDALLLVTGALFTFGADADLLKHVSTFSKLVYATTTFCGISLLALLVTVLANKWLRER